MYWLATTTYKAFRELSQETLQLSNASYLTNNLPLQGEGLLIYKVYNFWQNKFMENDLKKSFLIKN